MKTNSMCLLARRRWDGYSAGLFGAMLCALSGCSVTPPVATVETVPAEPHAVLALGVGVVVGTVSYSIAEAGNAPPRQMMITFERLAPGAAVPQDYVLVVNLDPATQRGFFAGPLPAGAYAFREAQAGSALHFGVQGIKMPFEVTTGQVVDVGHYNLDPRPPVTAAAYAIETH